MIADEVVPERDVSAAVERAAAELTSAGTTSLLANRKALRVGARAARRVPSLHGELRARAGLLPLQPGAHRQPRAQLGRQAQDAVTDDRRPGHPRADAGARHDDDLRQPGLDRAALLQGRARRLPLRARAAGVVGGRDGRRVRAGEPATPRSSTCTPRSASATRMGSIFTAMRNQTPLVITAGQQSRELLVGEPFLFSEQATELPKPYVKWSGRAGPGRRRARGDRPRLLRRDAAAVRTDVRVDPRGRLGCAAASAVAPRDVHSEFVGDPVGARRRRRGVEPAARGPALVVGAGRRSRRRVGPRRSSSPSAPARRCG